MDKKKTILILGMFGIIFMFFGGSLAYWQWETSIEQQTNVVFTVEKDFECAVDGGGNITSEQVSLVPTDCTNSTYAIKREVTVTPTLYKTDLSVAMDLWLDVNSIGSGLSGSENFKYVLTTSDSSCTEGIVGEGTFNGTSTGSKAMLFERKIYPSTTTETYYLYIWLDSAETSSSTMNQEFDLSLNGSCTNDAKTAYAVYSEDDTSLRFYKTDDVINVGDTYNGKTVTAVYTGFENEVYTSNSDVPWAEYVENITSVSVEDEIAPVSTAYWFYGFKNTLSLNLTNLNVSNVTNMSYMFYQVSWNNTNSFEIVGMDSWDVSNVTDMSSMFHYAGAYPTELNIGDLSNWDVSGVTNMNNMFRRLGRNSISLDIGDLSNWDVSNVTDMSNMFREVGYTSEVFDIGNLSNWDVSNVTNMMSMFYTAGTKATTWNIGDLSKWDVSGVINMNSIFYSAGKNATTWSIGDLSTKTVTRDDGSTYIAWDTSSVTNMRNMFNFAGYSATTFDIGDLSKWDTSNVTDMGVMFANAGYSATSWNVGNLSGWNTSSVTNMGTMFKNAGYTATNWSLDLSGWSVDNVTSYSDFNTGVETKITAPTWVS